MIITLIYFITIFFFIFINIKLKIKRNKTNKYTYTNKSLLIYSFISFHLNFSLIIYTLFKITFILTIISVILLLFDFISNSSNFIIFLNFFKEIANCIFDNKEVLCMEHIDRNNIIMDNSDNSESEDEFERNNTLAELIGQIQQSLDIFLNSENHRQRLFYLFHTGSPNTALTLQNFNPILNTILNEFEITESSIINSLSIIRPSELLIEGLTQRQYIDLFVEISGNITDLSIITSATFVKLSKSYLQHFISYYTFDLFYQISINLTNQPLPYQAYGNILSYSFDPVFGQYVNQNSIFFNLLIETFRISQENINILINSLEPDTIINEDHQDLLEFQLDIPNIRTRGSSVENTTNLINYHREYLRRSGENYNRIYINGRIPNLNRSFLILRERPGNR